MTQAQYNIAKQTIRSRHIKIELLNFNWQTIDSLEGYAIGGSISYDSTSDLRRSCSIQMVVNDSTFDVKSGGAIFLNRYIKIYIGEQELPSGNIVWYNKGIYLINSPTYKYSAEDRTLSFEGLDLVSKMTGLRSGNLVGNVTRKIPVGSVVKDVVIAILQSEGFNNYIVKDCPYNTPQDYEFSQGSTVWDMLTTMRDVYPMTQMYFDVDGVFHYEPIPTGSNLSSIATDDIWEHNVISEDITVDFEGVKNTIEIYGTTHEPQYYAVGTTSGTTVTLDYGGIEFANGEIASFTISTAISQASTIAMMVDTDESTYSFNLVNDNGDYVTDLAINTTYVMVFNESSEDFTFLGQIQPYATIVDTNSNSPFNVYGEAGIISIALYGGEYENIQTDYLAKQRAIYELYTRCRLNDTITLLCVPIWFLDVNDIVSYTTKNNVSTNQYLIKSISMDLSESGNMNIVMSKYYPTYPS